MDIIESSILNNGIGVDIGDGIMDYFFQGNSILPIKSEKTFTIDEFVTEDTKLDIYYGINELVQDNKLLHKLNITGNHKIINIDIRVTIGCILFINIYSDIEKILYLSLKLDNILLPKCYIKYDLHNIKLKYYLQYIIKKINIRLNSNSITIPNNLKTTINHKLQVIVNEIDSYQNQQLIEKINKLKSKFAL